MDLIGNKSPWTREHCGRPLCPPCKTTPGSCRATNLVYQISCLECSKVGRKSSYIGESHRSWWDMSHDYLTALKTRNETYAIVRHWSQDHSDMGQPSDFKFEVMRKCRTSLQRQILEAILINKTPCDQILTGRGEWGFNVIPRLTATEDGKLVP